MTGTILLTGANGSLGIHAVDHLLANFPEYTLLLTVRNTTASDPNTARLLQVIAKHGTAKVSLRKLDLSKISEVHDFITTVQDDIKSGKLPSLKAFIANAYWWTLVTEAQITAEGIEKTLQVNFVTNVALSLRLLGNFSSDGGRIVLIGSDAHIIDHNPMQKYAPKIAENLDQLAKPVDENVDVDGHGFERYANSKLALITWGHALNRRLAKDEKLSGITVVMVNPGNLYDSRAIVTNAPQWMVDLSNNLQTNPDAVAAMAANDPTLRLSRDAAIDVANFAANTISPNQRGYFTMVKADESSPESRDEATQDRLWTKSLEWARVSKQQTSLALLD